MEITAPSLLDEKRVAIESRDTDETVRMIEGNVGRGENSNFRPLPPEGI